MKRCSGNVADAAEGIKGGAAGLSLSWWSSELRRRGAGRHSGQQLRWRPDYPAGAKGAAWCSRSRRASICSIWRHCRKDARCAMRSAMKPPIAEYIMMALLALHHRLFQIAGEFR